jgi:hypothetical protein
VPPPKKRIIRRKEKLQMEIALLNASSYYQNKMMDLSRIARAVSRQLRYHASPAWGAHPWICTLYTDASYVPSTAYRLWVLDSSDQADALGYHDQDPDGFPYGRVFVEPSIASGIEVSTVVSHEAVEIFGDAEVNLWAQMPDGNLIAYELCDPVEADSYPTTIDKYVVWLSNFVYPEYFDAVPETDRFDHLRKLMAPFTMTSGGYQILMQGVEISTLFGRTYNKARWDAKKHPASRTRKRLRRTG